MRKTFKDVKDLFGDLLGKPFEVSLGGKTLDLVIKMCDIHSFMTLKPSDSGMSKEDAVQIADALRGILHRSYMPYWNAQSDSVATNLSPEQKQENIDTESMLEAFLVRNFIQFPIQ